MKHMVRRFVCLATVAGLSFGAFADDEPAEPEVFSQGGISWTDPSIVAKTVGGNAEEHSTLERMYRTALEEAKVRDTRQSNPGPSAVWGGNYYVDRMTGRRV